MALDLSGEYEKLFLSKRTVLPPNTSAAMYFRLAVVYFILQDYSKSLQLVNEILNSSGPFISSQLYVLSRLLNLLIHLELGNEDYLFYEIKSVTRKLKSSKKMFMVEQITLKFLSRWLNTNERAEAFQYYAAALEELEENDYENQLLRQFPFRKWAKSHLKKQPMKDVIMAKTE